MELLQKYWYLAIIAFIGLFLLARQQQSSGMSIQQIGGSNGETLALAQLASAEREADEQRRFGLIGTLLSYDISKIQLGQNIDLAKISADAQVKAAQSQYQLAALQAQNQQYQINQQAQLQNQALMNAYNAQRRNDWIGAISTGIQTIIPSIFGDSTSGGFGGFNFPSTPPIFGGRWF